MNAFTFRFDFEWGSSSNANSSKAWIHRNMVVQGLTTAPIFCSFFSVNNINAIERLEFIQKEHSNVRIIDTNSPEFVVCHTEKSIYIIYIMSSEENTANNVAATTAALATAWTVAYATNTAGAVAGILGFSAPGITAGSTAAGMMSAAATSGIGGGVISFLQSVGAHFALATGGGFLATTAAIAAPIAAGIGLYSLLSSSSTTEDQKKKTKKDGTGPSGQE